MASSVIVLALVGETVIVGVQAVRLRHIRRELSDMHSDLRRTQAQVRDQDEASLILRRALRAFPSPSAAVKPALVPIRGRNAPGRKYPRAVVASTVTGALSLALLTGSAVMLWHAPPSAVPQPQAQVPLPTSSPTAPDPGPVVIAQLPTVDTNTLLLAASSPSQTAVQSTVTTAPTSPSMSSATTSTVSQGQQPSTSTTTTEAPPPLAPPQAPLGVSVG